MLTALRLALADALQPEQRGAVLASIALAIVLLVALWLGATLLLSGLNLAGLPWLDTAIEILGSLGALVLAWVLFPAMTMLILGFFLDGVVAAVERRHYPELPPARHIGIGEAVASALRILVLALIVNLVLLPVYFLPPLNLVAPIVAAAFMLHVFEGVRRRPSLETFAARGRTRLIGD